MTPDQIKAFRARHSLTQEQFAKALGVPVRTVQEWEAKRGKGNPPAYLKLALTELERELKKRGPKAGRGKGEAK